MQKLTDLIDHVLPEESVLFKMNHGSWAFYLSPEEFESEDEYTAQGTSESFADFMKRTIKKLIEDEARIGADTVTIDHAIFLNSKF